MANVTTSKNFPTPYDLRMEAKRALMKPPTNVGGVGSLFNNLKDVVSSPKKAGNALSGLLGRVPGGIVQAYNTPDTSPVGTNEAEFNNWRSENRFRTPAYISATDTGRGLANLPKGYARDELLLSANADGSSGLRNFGTNYNNRELAAGQSAENYRTGAGFPGQSPAAERAYQGEVLRTAQLAAQSPEMLAYAAQREKDLKSKDYSKSEDMGMRIWAQKYGPGSKNDLASKVKPGQAGYDVIQEVIKGKAAPSAAGPTAMGYNPFAINAYSSNFKLPGMEEYANSMQGAIVRAPGITPSYAMDNPMQGDYNSTVNQGYNLSFPIVPTTTVNTNSAAMGAALYTPNSSVQAMGNFAGPPIKLPIGNTPFGATGYPAFTAGSLLPNLTREQVFGPKAEGKFNAMFSANR